MKFVLAAAASLALVAGGVGAGVAQAEAAPGCPSTVQIGSTAYITYGGETIASVKQFKGCNQNWAYTYVWDQFRAKHTDYTIDSYIDAGFDPLGFTRSAKGAHEMWSNGTNTLSVCTQAAGAIWGDDLYGAVETSKRC